MSDKSLLSLQNRINHLLLDFALATGIPCYFYDMAGRQMGDCSYDSRSNFCRFIHFFDTNQVCPQSYLHNCIYAEEKKKPYTYYCPYGLMNITYPIFHPGLPPYFITMGPLLLKEPDDLILNNILKVNYTLQPRYRELRQRLGEILIKSESEIRAMVEVLDISIQGVLAGITATTLEEANQNTGQDGVLETLDTWLQKYEETTETADPLSQYLPTKDSRDLTVEDIITYTQKMIDVIFQGKDFDEVKYRAMKYVESLITLCQTVGIHLDLIFNTQCIDIDKFIQCDNDEELSFLIGNMEDRFIQSCISGSELTNRDIIFRAMEYIRSHYSDISLSDVAGVVGLSPAYFSSLFKKETGLSYSGYLNRIRIAQSKRLLRRDGTIADIALTVGYSDQSYFSNVFRKCEGVTPKTWRDAHQD